MKKISILSMLALITMPALATESATVADKVNTEVVKTEQIANKFETSNPKIKFPRGLQLGIGVSPTSGINGFVGYNNKNFNSFWAKRFGVRFDMATYSPIKSKLNKEINEIAGKGEDGVEIGDMKIENFALDGKHYGAMIDFYPFGNTWFLGGWRITGGYLVGKLDVDADLKGSVDGLPAGTVEFEFDGTKYRYLGNEVYGTATADWKFHGPYVGTGFDLGLFWGIKIYMDAGVVFTNKAAELDLKVDVNNLQYYDGANWQNFAGDPNYDNLVADFNARKDAELQDAQDELDKYKFYPIMKLGIVYRF